MDASFLKLLINFAWWVNKVDSEGNNVFEGGFLGLDNITIFDRSQTPTDGATLKQADATGWMNMAQGYADSMISMFTRDENGSRPIFGTRATMQSDPHWKDCLLH